MFVVSVSRPHPTGWLLTYVLCLVVLVAFQQGVGLVVSTNTRLFQAVASGAHVPWFAAVTWLLCEIGRQWIPERRARYTFIIVAAVGLALATEVAQLFTARNASVADVGRNALGMLTGLSLYALGRKRHVLARGATAGLVTVVLACLAIGAAPALYELSVRLYLQSIAPELLRPDSAFGLAPLAHEANVSRVDGGLWAPELHGTPMLRVQMQTDRQWPGIALREPLRDWSECEALALRIYLPGDEGMRLTLRVLNWTEESPGPMARLDVTPGASDYRVPLQALFSDERLKREVRQLIIYSGREAAGRAIGFESIRLVECAARV